MRRIVTFSLGLLLVVGNQVRARNSCDYTIPENRLHQDERKVAFDVRYVAAKALLHDSEVRIGDKENADEMLRNFAGSFTKGFHHNKNSGLLTRRGVKQYNKFLKALRTGKQEDFNSIKLAPNNIRVLINPQAAFTFSMKGGDSSQFEIPAPPNISSAHIAAEMLEVYLQAILRDVPFDLYGTGMDADSDGMGNSITEKAAAVLDDLGQDYKGPRNKFGHVDARVLFRGNTRGDLIGPYLSQFLLQPLYPLFPSGCAPFVAGLIGVGNLNQDVLAIPQHLPIPQKREFGVSWHDFIAIQNGEIPKPYALSDYDQSNVRYPITGRDMGSLVHTDSPYQAYYNALNILTYWDFPRSKVFPYQNGSIKNEGDGHNMGIPDAYALIGEVCLEAFKAAWMQKFRVWRYLRPEAFAGLVHRVKVTGKNPFNLHSSLFSEHNGVDVLEWVRNTNKLQATTDYDPEQLLSEDDACTYLLAQMYPEGSPFHPSYVSGHATVAGACTAVIKAIFDDQFKLKRRFAPVKVDLNDPTQLIELSGEGEHKMTVGSELDKLASNISLARDFGGVHYRIDGEQGMRLGEQVAIRLLQDHARTYPEQGFQGFEFTKRDGTRIRILPDEVRVVS